MYHEDNFDIANLKVSVLLLFTVSKAAKAAGSRLGWYERDEAEGIMKLFLYGSFLAYICM